MKMKNKSGMLSGLFLLLLGVIFLLNNFGIVNIPIGQIWPIFLIVPGIFMILGLHEKW